VSGRMEQGATDAEKVKIVGSRELFEKSLG
jgi:hypothetical protein